MATALARITDLFVEGRELVLRPDPPALVWVNKLNAFEMDEARKEGAVARARFILALKEIGSPEKDLFEASLADASLDSLRTALVEHQAGKWWMAASNAIRSDPEWTERYQMIERPTSVMTDAEKELMAKVQLDYLDELQSRVAGFQKDYEVEIGGYDLAKLMEMHRESWANTQALGSFSREFRRAQLFYCLRTCKAVSIEGRWNHADCDHKRLCDSLDDVGSLPDELANKVLALLQELVTDSDDARFSAGAVSSSAPSPRPSEAEESPVSGPEVTSAELATTSS